MFQNHEDKSYARVTHVITSIYVDLKKAPMTSGIKSLNIEYYSIISRVYVALKETPLIIIDESKKNNDVFSTRVASLRRLR